MQLVPVSVRDEIIVLFKKRHTIREIADLTGFNKQTILEFLTKEGYWSQNCSSCVIKRCYDCTGLEEFGRPVSVQDRIDFLARMKK